MTAPAAGWHVDEALAALGRLREAWTWLAALREPGKSSTTARYMTDRQREVEAAQVRRDKAAQAEALRGGTLPGHSMDPALRGTPTVPLGPHADAGRPAVIAARVEIASTTVRLAGATYPWMRSGTLPATTDPTMRVPTGLCWWCRGSGWLPRGPSWTTTPDPVPCPRCRRGQMPTGAVCAVCDAGGSCACDGSDAAFSVALSALGDALPYLAGTSGQDGEIVADDARRSLNHCDRLARRVARVIDDRRRIHARCPACGHRDLWADVSSTDEREWSAACHNPLCSCRGSACGCGRPVRYEGRRHRWPASEWPGRHGFAARLGVDLRVILDLDTAMGRAS